MELGEDRRLSLSLLSSDLEYGNPGALTRAEFESDPHQNVFNTLDGTDDATRQAVLSFQGSVGGGFSLAGNVAYRTEAATTLSTGRAAPAFGGFFLDAEGGTWSGAVQATRDVTSSLGSHLIAFGAEILDGETESTGFFTDPASPGSYDPSLPASRNTAGALNSALFLQDAWTLSSRWIVTAGARGDRSDVRYDETIPGTTPSDDKTFSEYVVPRRGDVSTEQEGRSLRLLRRRFPPADRRAAVRVSAFGSNPDLAPEDSRAYEFGARTHGRLGGLEVALFWIDTKDEIVFDPTPTPDDHVRTERQRRRDPASRRRGVGPRPHRT